METITDIRYDASIPESDRRQAERRLIEYLDLRSQVRELEQKMNAAKEVLTNILLANSVFKTRYESYNVSLRRQERRTISKQKLIENGVSPEIIARSEDVTDYLVLDVRESETEVNVNIGIQ
jgi:hypothetical protein